jgi:O-acetylhomoserine (thiol)-lyase
MPDKHYKFDTLRIRAGYVPAEHNNAVSVPIYQTTSYDFKDTAHADRLFSFSEAGWLYSRVNNPTVDVLEQRVAALDGGAAAIALSSGMAAITYTLLNLAEGGGRILTSPYLYGGSADGFKKIYPKLNIDVAFSENFLEPEKLEKEIDSRVKALYVESISNPLGIVADLAALAEIAHRHGIPLVVDNTFATPYLLNPLAHGADIVIYSATKALNGHGNLIAGLVVESGKFPYDNGNFPQFLEPYYTLRDRSDGRERSYFEVFPETPFTARIRLNYLNYFGASLGPFDAYLTLIGLETLSERIAKQVANTEKIIRYLQGNKWVSWVRHPYTAEGEQKRLRDKYLPRGAGSVLAFGFKGTAEQSDRFINATKLFSYHVNVGDARSLIVNSPRTTHGELTPEEKRLAGISEDLIRLSIGIEDAEDLIADLDRAFAEAEK